MDIDNQGATPEVVEPLSVEQVEQPEKSMDDTIRETLASVRERDTTPEAIVAPESDEEKATRLRNEKGQFAAQAVEAVADPAASVIATDPADIAPNTWKKEAAEKWATLPPEIKAEIQRRENDVHKGIAQYREAANFGEAIHKAITPYTDTLQRLGVTPDAAISELMAADHKLRFGNPQEKVAYFAQLAQNYSIDIGGVQQYADSQPYVDPATQALQQQFNQLQNYVQQQQQTQQQQAQQQFIEQANAEVSKFAADPANKHLPAVTDQMAMLIQANPALSLKDAYDQSVWANPQTRALMIAEQQAAQAAAAKAKAEAAKKAGSAVRGRPSLPPVAAPLSMDEDIRQQLRAARGL